MATVRPDLFHNLAGQLHDDPLFRRIIQGEVRVPYTERALVHGFPPALIPLWARGSGTIVGLWKHWFTTDRRPTFVEYYGTTVHGRRYMVFEVGRTLKQLLYSHLLESISISNEVDDEIETFARACGISDLAAVERLSLEDCNPKMFRSHPEFAGLLPLSFFEEPDTEQYAGDFPTSRIRSDFAGLRRYCVPEVHSGFRDLLPDYQLREEAAESPESPEWFRTRRQPGTFAELLNEGDLAGAWMSLNSPHWTFAEARLAILQLAARAENRPFADLASVWAKLPYDDDFLL